MLNDDDAIKLKHTIVSAELDRFIQLKMGMLGLCDSCKKWMITIWFATLVYALKEDWSLADISTLLLSEVLMFYILEIIFRGQVMELNRYIHRIEQWIVETPFEEYLNVTTTFRESIGAASTTERLRFAVNAMKDRFVFPFFAAIALLSFAVPSSILISKANKAVDINQEPAVKLSVSVGSSIDSKSEKWLSAPDESP